MLIPAKPPKEKACKNCRTRFVPTLRMQVVCGPMCGMERARKQREAKERRAAAEDRKQTRAALEKFKSRAKWEEECRAIVQAIVRIRDRNDGCISCHLPASWGGQWHGSHFRSHGAASAVQFHLWNIHKACSPCNRDKGGNVIEYRPRLVAKIGQERVDWLMAQNQTVRHDVDYYKRFKKVMGKRLRRMENNLKKGM